MANLGFAGSMISTLVRGTAGISTRPAELKPAIKLQLYDIENCPYCRLVRETLTELNLDLEILPCPKNGTRYRQDLIERAGKAQFPYLVDPNTEVEMYESLDIVAYLYETYGRKPLPLKWRAGGLQVFGSMLASAPGATRSMQAKTGRMPELLLELYSFESSPYARPVRELLCRMEIPYIVRNCGRSELTDWLLPPIREALNISPDSPLDNRQFLLENHGKVSIPFLYDPNSDSGLFESEDIQQYLLQEYA
ncbi:MAG: glutathione S-transferase N-terminal domain-containing protein [Halioglobus sp.]